MLELKTNRLAVLVNSIWPLAWIVQFFILAVIVGHRGTREFTSSPRSDATDWYAVLLLILALLLAALSLPGLYVISHAIRAIRAAPVRVAMAESIISDGCTDGSIVIARSSVKDVQVRRGMVVIGYTEDGTSKTIELHRMGLRDRAFKRFVASVRSNLRVS